MSALSTAFGLIRFATGSHHAWMWLFFGTVFLLVLAFWRFYEERQSTFDLAVFVGNISIKEASYFTGNANTPGWICVLSSVRITNRDKATRVTLGPSLTIETGLNCSLYADEAPAQAFKVDPPAGQPQWLRTPIRVEPTDTETGFVGFWLHPSLAGEGRQLDPALKALNEPDGKAELILIDYVSDRHITLTVPGSYP